MAEDGSIPYRYPVTVLPGSGYRKRTRQNVIDSDGTVIIYFGAIAANSGTAMTAAFCIQEGRPHVLIDVFSATVETAAEMLSAFCAENNVATLNVAGPRSSHHATAHGFTQSVTERFLELCSQR